MVHRFVSILLFALFPSGFGLECMLPPSSQVYANSTVYIPGPTADLQPLPANFNCIYRIQAPVNTTYGLYINLELKNGMKGLNDYIMVTDMDGYQTKYDNRTRSNGDRYIIIPGAEIKVQVVTKSVLMGSMFSMVLVYHANDIGPNIPMKTGTEMNYYDVSTLRDGRNFFNTVTFTNNEPIHLTFAQTDPMPVCNQCFVVCGTLQNYTRIYNIVDVISGSIMSSYNAITVVTSSDKFLGIVLNSLSEVSKFSYVEAIAVPETISFKSTHPSHTNAVEVVNFKSTGIIMDYLNIKNTNCSAYAVSGAPNDSSKVILDLKNAQIPHNFGLNYFSVVTEECEMEFSVSAETA